MILRYPEGGADISKLDSMDNSNTCAIIPSAGLAHISPVCAWTGAY